MRSARAFALVLALAALAAPAAAPDMSTVTNPKTFFWAPGQSPTGTVSSVTNDVIYHGGAAGPGALHTGGNAVWQRPHVELEVD